MPRPQPDHHQRGTEHEGQKLFERLVRVETIDGGLADGKTEAAGDRRSNQEPAQEGDAVSPRVPAPQDDQRRRQRQRAGRRGEPEEQHVTAGVDHVLAAMPRILGRERGPAEAGEPAVMTMPCRADGHP